MNLGGGINILTAPINTTGGGGGGGVPDNAMLWDDGTPVFWDDGTYILWA